MKKFLSHPYLPFLLAGLLAGIAILYQSLFFSLICLVPLFWNLFEREKISFLQGGLFALSLSVLLFFWMIQGAERFTGASMIYGLLVFLLCAVLFSVYWGSVVWLIGRLYSRFKTLHFFLGAAVVAAIWTLAESLFVLLTQQLPWFGFRVGFGMSSNLYAIQYASLAGIGLISFAGILFNYCLAFFLYKKDFIKLRLTIGAFGVFLLGGWLLLYLFEKEKTGTGTVRIAIATQNIDPETKWNEASGNALAAQVITLSRQAATAKPDLVLWSESILPWTFQQDDDLVKEIVKAAPGAHHILGMSTAHADNEVYNSAYYLKQGGAVAGSYHKRYPLALIEEPVGGYIFPFLSSSGFEVKRGEEAEVLTTSFGRAGVMICNESAIPKAAAELVSNGAGFLLNISNDGWFSETFIAASHFQHARLRAVETRRDIAINSNKGFSGSIAASGKVQNSFRNDAPTVEMVQLTTRQDVSLYVSFPYMLPLICLLILLTGFIRISVDKKSEL